MAKLNKMYYYTSKGEKKLNCYTIPVSKEVVEKAKLENVDLQVIADNNTIIIKKRNRC